MKCSICKEVLATDFVTATGSDGDYTVELHRVPALRCPDRHEIKPTSLQFDTDFSYALGESDSIAVPIEESDDPDFKCPKCGREVANAPVSRLGRDIKIEIPELPPFEVHVTGPFVTCLECQQVFLLPVSNGKNVGGAFRNALQNAGLWWEERSVDTARYVTSLVAFLVLMVAWLGVFLLGLKWFTWRPASNLDLIMFPIFVVWACLCIFGLCLSWMVLMKPLLREEEMQVFVLWGESRSGLWNRFFRRLLAWIY